MQHRFQRPRAGLWEGGQGQAGLLGRIMEGAGIHPRRQGVQLEGEAGAVLQVLLHEHTAIGDGAAPAVGALVGLIGSFQQVT
jgi:hypothetical protein